ncbi:DUF262 domain-containing protein [Acinetobacter pittii]|uniref:GmrSD restriction endonucleases N-terminal domain-containing protein n=1 Tax=Acinetobacter pittii TaxID=48296 RepID=A0A6S4UUJ9_ACIPI|nr:DUF262 domain-containing protein [Acinetobacter pittii]MBN6508814.1 DUF262 domain-containing protein [Acinetobacter pittii]MDX8187215.1 DUF262 domain-containing protein [Acinetobacter pittii]OCY92049.1 hypothetical protein BFR67_04615 [Acinetobacter pittii]WPP83123.1 DUF262 domain-containing protein [Acinetobacter pittii]BBQ50234.1 hypothetical protein WP2W18E11_32320 [Acinetobacter pittii]
MKNKEYSYSEPSIRFIEQILSDIRNGDLLPPKFQRPFIWSNERKIELLNSIRDGIPIGSIMVWRTKDSEVAIYDVLGRFKLNNSNRNLRKEYILDGLQRLSTLFSALNKPDVESLDSEGGLQDYVYFYYNIISKDFFVEKQYFICNEFQMPLNILLDSIGLIKFQRNISKVLSDQSLIEEIVDDLDQLASKFRNYKIPVISIATDDLNLVTETFRKINSQGQVIEDEDMLHALTWSTNYDFNDTISYLRIKHLQSCNWGFIDNDIILKTIKLNLNQNIYKTNAVSLGKAIQKDKEIVEISIYNIKDAIVFCDDVLEIPSVLFLPYTLQLVAIAHLFGQLKLEGKSLTYTRVKIIKSWFWFTSYTEAFSGMSDNDFKKSISELVFSVVNEDVFWSNHKIKYEEFNGKFSYNFRSVKSKRSILNLARLQNEFGKRYLKRSATSLLNEYGKESIRNIFNIGEVLVDPYSGSNIHKTFANKVILSPNEFNGDFREEFFSLNSTHSFIDGFNFSEDATFDFAPLLDSNPFLEKRQEYLQLKESEFSNKTAGWFWENNIFKY